MNKLITMLFCTLLVLLVVQTAPAQTIGFKAGMSSSKLAVSDDEGVNQDRLSSLAVGGFLRLPLSGFALQIEALGLTKGTKVTEDGESVKLKLDYIEIPVTAMFALGNGPYVFGGGAVAFETGCKFDVEFGGGDTSFDCDGTEFFDIPFDRKKTDFSVLAGAGFQFPAGPGSLLVEGRYTWGLVNLLDDDTSDDSIKNRSLTFFAGYAVPIGRR